MRIAILFALLLSVAAAPVHGGTERLPDGAVLLTAISPLDGLDVDVDMLQRQVRSGEADAVLAALAGMPDPLRREATAARLLERLQQQGDPLPDVLLDGIAARPVQIFRRQEETLADWFAPVFDLPAQVQSLRALAARVAAVDAVRATLEAKSSAALANTLAQADPRVAALAVRSASDAAVAQLAAVGKAGRVMLPSPVLAEIAARRVDAPSMIQAIDAAEPIDVLPLFDSVVPALAPGDAKAVVHAALARPDYASRAAFALVALPRDAETDTMLAHALRDGTTGASVAAALASAPGGIARLDTLLQDVDADAIVLAHVALALRLRGDSAARAWLDRLAGDPRLPGTLRAELRR